MRYEIIVLRIYKYIYSMSIGSEFLSPQPATGQWLAKASTDASMEVRRSYYIAKNAEYTAKWATFTGLTQDHQKNVLAATHSLGEYCDLNFTAFAASGLCRQAAEGVLRLLNPEIAVSKKREPSSLLHRARRLMTSSLYLLSSLATVIAFGDQQGIFTPHPEWYRLRKGLSHLRSISYVTYYGESLADRTENVMRGAKKISTDLAFDIIWDLKSIIISASRLLPGKGVNSTLALSLNTICGWYYFGKAISQVEQDAKGLKQAQAQCRALGLK